MSWEAISAVGQLIGAIAIVVSLIYVAAEAATTLARRVLLQCVLCPMPAEDADLGALWLRGIRDFEAIDGADLVRFNALVDHLFRSNEDMYYQHLEENLDPRVWRGFEAPMRDINAYPGVQAWWRSRSHWFSEQFAQFITERQRTAKAPSLYREAEADK